MKTFAFALVLTLAFPLTALAAPTGWKPADQCTVPPDHGIYSDDGLNTLIGCITDEAWQAAAAAQAAQNSENLPVVAAGSTVTDEMGVQYTCPWYVFEGCYDLTHTAAYRSAMQSTARQLIAEGFTAQSAPVFAGWINSVQ
jgi:hypothetical protein